MTRPAAAVAVEPVAATASGVSLTVWAMLLMSAVLAVAAALPAGLTYRVSTHVGRAFGVVRLPLAASALALTAGVVIALFLGSA